MTSDERARAERDLLRTLLRAGRSEEPRGLLEQVLVELVRATSSRRCFLELLHPVTDERFTLKQGCTDEEADHIRSTTSRGIVAATLESGEVLHTSSAQLDPRFSKLESVRSQQLEAVLCVPVPGKPAGVLYLEGRRGMGPFADDDIELAREVALAVGPVLHRAATFFGARRNATGSVRQRLEGGAAAVIGKSEALAHVLEQVAMAAPIDVTVLITGEPGTGKTQLAKLVHDNSRRRGGPFKEINCAAMQDTLIEGELFGTTAGAFTGARTAAGLIKSASGGTVFLDEVGELSPLAQGKLLQVLQSRQYRAVGSDEVHTANVRIIAATNARLEELVKAGRFREDLFYRLNVLPIRMPALRERPEDIGEMVTELVRRIAIEHDLPPIEVSPALRTRLELEAWPGNVRQLRNRLETALIYAASEKATQVEPRHFDPSLPREARLPSYHDATRSFQREFLQRQLDEVKGNVAELARKIDLSRPYLSDLLKSFQINR